MTDDSQPLNREQRRKQKFSRKAPTRQDNLRTQMQNNSGFLTEQPEPVSGETGDMAAADAAAAAAPDSSTTETGTATTGPGAGGATESADRAPHHEGLHGGPQRKS